MARGRQHKPRPPALRKLSYLHFLWPHYSNAAARLPPTAFAYPSCCACVGTVPAWPNMRDIYLDEPDFATEIASFVQRGAALAYAGYGCLTDCLLLTTVLPTSYQARYSAASSQAHYPRPEATHAIANVAIFPINKLISLDFLLDDQAPAFPPPIIIVSNPASEGPKKKGKLLS